MRTQLQEFNCALDVCDLLPLLPPMLLLLLNQRFPEISGRTKSEIDISIRHVYPISYTFFFCCHLPISYLTIHIVFNAYFWRRGCLSPFFLSFQKWRSLSLYPPISSQPWFISLPLTFPPSFFSLTLWPWVSTANEPPIDSCEKKNKN